MNRLAVVGLLITSACRASPAELAEQATQAVESGELSRLEPLLHPQYADALGDRAALFTDLGNLVEAFPARDIRFEAIEVERGEELVLRGVQHIDLAGGHTVKMLGPLRWQLEAGATKLEIRSGFLDDLRDIEALLAARRAALEANDAEAYGRLIHPDYRDGDMDRTQVMAQLRTDLEGVVLRFEPIHHQIEVRKDLAHVDERYNMKIGEQAFPRGLARLTLRTSLGRWRIAAGLYSP